MSESKRIRRNTLFSLLSITSRLIANVILFWVIARYYGPAIFGQFTFAHTLSFIFIIFADFGTDVLLTYEIARNRKNAEQIFQQYFSVKFLFTVVSLIGMWAFAVFTNINIESKILVIIFSVYMVFTTLTNFLFAFYRGFERLEYETKVSFFINSSLFILTLLLIIIKANIMIIGGAFIFSRLIGFMVGIKYAKLLLKNISFKIVLTDLFKLKNKVIIFGLHLTFNYLLFQLDTILLTLWKGNYEVGIYQSVFKLILIPLVIPDILTNTLTPSLARFYVDNHIIWKKTGQLMSKVLLITSIPITMILFLFPRDIISLIYGMKNYSGAIPILRLFSFIIFSRFLFEAYALMLTTSNKQHVRMYVVIVATLINFVLNYFMIHKYGAYGAAIVALVTNIFLAAMYLVSNISLFYKWVLNFKTIILLISTLIVGYIFGFMVHLNLFVSAPVICLIFLVVGYFYFFSNEDKRFILSVESAFSSLKIKFF